MAYLKWKRLLLSENIFLKNSFLSKKRRLWVHEINEARSEYGEYHHLMPQLREDEEKFRDYFRMSSSTFDSLLEYIKEDITKQNTNFRNSISAEERLVVAIR